MGKRCGFTLENKNKDYNTSEGECHSKKKEPDATGNNTVTENTPQKGCHTAIVYTTKPDVTDNKTVIDDTPKKVSNATITHTTKSYSTITSSKDTNTPENNCHPKKEGMHSTGKDNTTSLR